MSYQDPYYSEQAYRYPLDESQPVVRLPVAGPEPFNTLAVVRLMYVPGVLAPAGNNLIERVLTVATPFTLIGCDPRVTPAPQHSTTVFLHRMDSGEAIRFTGAVNDVWGHVPDDGTWMLSVDSAALAVKYDFLGEQEIGTYGEFGFYASSWVLCYEPPPPTIPGVDSTMRTRHRQVGTISHRGTTRRRVGSQGV
jgi:hypothetical protein